MKTIYLTLIMAVLSVGVYAQTANKASDLDKYLGVYSTNSVPLKFTISKDGATLVGRGTGQAPFILETTGQDKFKNDRLGLLMEFNPVRKEFILMQGGQTFLYKRDQVQKPEPEFIEKGDK